MDTPTPLERLIYAACGIPDGPPPPLPGDLVTLRCSRCARTARVERLWYEPTTAMVVVFPCDRCTRTSDAVVRYYDADGQEIVEGDAS